MANFGINGQFKNIKHRNIGGGAGLLVNNTMGGIVSAKTLVAGNNINISSTNSEIIIDSTASGGGGGVETLVTTTNSVPITIPLVNLIPTFPNNKTTAFLNILVIAGVRTGTQVGGFSLKAVYKNSTGVSVKISSVTDSLEITELPINVALGSSGSNITITVIGVAGTIIDWKILTVTNKLDYS